jgi:tRNA(adenine34) deaminase
MGTVWAKIGRIVYGAEREDVHPMYFEVRHVDTIAFVHKACRDDIEIEGG